MTELIIYVTETAENIGYSCNLLREEMNEVFIISGNTPEDVRQELRSEEALSFSGKKLRLPIRLSASESLIAYIVSFLVE